MNGGRWTHRLELEEGGARGTQLGGAMVKEGKINAKDEQIVYTLQLATEHASHVKKKHVTAANQNILNFRL